MDRETGRIIDPEVFGILQRFAGFDPRRYVQMEVPPTPKQMARKPPRVGRNDPCPCGSGKKFKQCCLKDPNDPRFQ